MILIPSFFVCSGMRLLYLPSYSPDLNPIEEAFSAIKAWLRSNRDYVLGKTEGPGCDQYALIWEAVYGVVTAEKAYGYHIGRLVSMHFGQTSCLY